MQRNHDEFNRKHVNDRLNDKNSDFGNKENHGEVDLYQYHYHVRHQNSPEYIVASLLTWMLA